LVPFVVETTKGGSNLTNVVSESIELSHLLNIGVAGIIGVHELGDIPKFTHDFEHIVEDATLHVLHEDALSWVLDTPVFGVVSNLLEVANLGILIENIDQLGSDILNLVHVDRPEVLMHLVGKIFDLVDWGLNPGTKALISDNFIVF
jgi:hypothetical protein